MSVEEPERTWIQEGLSFQRDSSISREILMAGSVSLEYLEWSRPRSSCHHCSAMISTVTLWIQQNCRRSRVAEMDIKVYPWEYR